MNIPHSAMPRLRMLVVVSFIVACAAFFAYLWTNMGGTIPGVSKSGYRVSLELDDADNLVYDSDVMVAGVRVGKVRELETNGGRATVVVQLDADSVIPLHDGATVQVRSKSLIEETYLEIVDGDGAALPDDAQLPRDAVKASVQLDEVLSSLDAPTRQSLRAALRALGSGTSMTHDQLSNTLAGLGMIGREGHDVLDALAAQSTDLQALVRESRTMVRALDGGRGELVQLVAGAERLTRATAANREDLEASMRRLPDLLVNARSASASLVDLSGQLAPITADVRAAASPLNAALLQLPDVSRDLRGLLPALDGTLTRAPRTLKAVSPAADQLAALVPTLRTDLADLNPALSFLRPYGPDLAAFFVNWTDMLHSQDANGHFLRIFPVLNEGSYKGLPIPLNYGVLDKSNAYPRPGESVNPGPFTGTYPRVERDAR